MLFDINNKDYSTFEVNGTVGYEIRDFYKYPDKIVEFISYLQPFYHKEDQSPSFNRLYFEDMRHACNVRGLNEVVDFLSGICGQQSFLNPNELRTNYFKMLDKEFNTYENNYWWPHIDFGYTALVYLDNFEYPGTNIYKALTTPDYNQGEHYKPWQSKSNWKVEHTIQAEFNKLVLFDGLNNPHAMVIDSDLFLHNTRLNQAIFFMELDKQQYL